MVPDNDEWFLQEEDSVDEGPESVSALRSRVSQLNPATAATACVFKLQSGSLCMCSSLPEGTWVAGRWKWGGLWVLHSLMQANQMGPWCCLVADGVCLL